MLLFYAKMETRAERYGDVGHATLQQVNAS
jgi:hypothetical protein